MNEIKERYDILFTQYKEAISYYLRNTFDFNYYDAAAMMKENELEIERHFLAGTQEFRVSKYVISLTAKKHK